MLWSLGGLLETALLALGSERYDHRTLAAKALQLTGAVFFPIVVLAVWRRFVSEGWQRTAMRAITFVAIVSAIGIAVLAWLPALSNISPDALPSVSQLTAWNGAAVLLAGALVSLRKTAPRAVYLPSLAIVGCACGAAAALSTERHTRSGGLEFHLESLGGHLILAIVLCAFLLFARFRYADIFVRYGVRIVLAGTWAAVISFIAQSPMSQQLAMHTHSPWAAHIFAVVLVANALLLSFTFIDDRLSAAVSRWLFDTPDYRAAAREFANRLRTLHTESEALAALEEAARRPLELSGARAIAIDALTHQHAPAGLLDGEIAELDPSTGTPELPHAEALIPISSKGRVTHALAVAPGIGRPGLVSNALDYLRGIAAQCGHRLDALRQEREAVERSSREALLLQQVTEAELKALRAQIHPHFLFNSLNTIADLIVRDPKRAEEMTLRLARVFRHVLAHLRHPLTSVRDEIAFLRTYLHIEEARFGERLQVEIEVDPAAEAASIPSLILQPLVENALKHGLGPKPGLGRLWITARAEGDAIRMTVEDDGVGPEAQPQRLPGNESQSVGLANVADRLRTLYQERGSVRLEPRPGGGSRATVIVPRSEEAHSL